MVLSQPRPMDISVIIRTLNEAKWLPELLGAIDNQNTRSWQTETIIVDSGSTDDTLKIARAHNCRIVTIQKSEFTFGRSLNIGCAAADGRFLVLISGHCVPLGKDWLYNLCTPLDKRICSYSYGRQIEREGYSKFSEKQLFFKYFPPQSKLPQDGFFCNNANSALLKDVWANQPFDEDVTGLEDMMLAKTLVSKGEKIGYIADAVVEHIHEERWQQVKRRYEREAIALQEIMPEVHFSWPDFFRYTLAGIMLDSSAALQEKRFCRTLGEIIMFRTMQFWGTFKGNNEHRKLSRKTKEKYFYPR
ncbi:glycosyltransferase family 2 protein [Altericroceibacterium endophyticum]|uniref:glycosyltransferase family 2 protein n=1 Tax=Altericroceibacterium endophyticum TaxID=1808508 RepID=UPI0019275EC9|nr:glycosyltransferase family 2 protein [Altericroceibacterium endophyticum]